jgi:hypothetical protein
MALTDNLLAYYKLDESSGNAFDSFAGKTLTNNNTVGFAAALINTLNEQVLLVQTVLDLFHFGLKEELKSLLVLKLFW